MEQKENITRTSHFLTEDMSWTCAQPVVALCGQLTYRAATSTNTEMVHSSGWRHRKVWVCLFSMPETTASPQASLLQAYPLALVNC